MQTMLMIEPTITAMLADGPLEGKRIEAEVVEGRPPKIIDVPADQGTTCRYCLADWVQTGVERSLISARAGVLAQSIVGPSGRRRGPVSISVRGGRGKGVTWVVELALRAGLQP